MTYRAFQRFARSGTAQCLTALAFAALAGLSFGAATGTTIRVQNQGSSSEILVSSDRLGAYVAVGVTDSGAYAQFEIPGLDTSDRGAS